MGLDLNVSHRLRHLATPWPGLIAVAVLLLGGPQALAAGAAVDSKAEAAKLEALRAKITELQAALDKARDAHRTHRNKLARSEKEIGRLTLDLAQIEKDLGVHRTKLIELERLERHNRAALAQQRQELARQLRAAFAMGRQGYLKILLSQRDVAEIGRSLTYYNYINQARARSIERISGTLRELTQLATVIKQQTETLEALRAKKREKLGQLASERLARESALAQLTTEIRSHELELEQAQGDARQLQRLLDGLREALEDIPAGSVGHSPFATLKGRLPWPTPGPVAFRFGQPREIGDLKWQGVLIDAAPGEDVRAISHGRIAFADWLRGFGLLIIIDHGNGYMSLYGHNQALLKDTGDWVEAGEVIATVGNSGGQTRPGLYFEIRHAGVPANPAQWCRADSRS